MGAHEALLGATGWPDERAGQDRLWDAVAVGVLILDPDRGPVFANALARQWLGLTSEQLSGAEPPPAGWQLTHEDGTPFPLTLAHATWDQLPSGATTRELYRLQHPGHPERWLELSAAPMRGVENAAGALLISVRDVTERHHLLRQAEANRKKFETIVETANEGIIVFDRELRIRFVNRRLSDLLGFDRGEVIGRSAIELYLDPEDAESAREAAEEMWSSLGAGRPIRTELWIPHKDGYRLWMLVSATPLYDALGNLTGSLSMLTDLTEQKAMQQVLDYLSLHDPLTDIPNRRLFQDRLGQGLVGARRDGTRLALMVLDLDGFKQVNDSFGHACGDAVLREVAARLKALLRESDTVARMGGDEFALLLRMRGEASEATVVSTIDRIRERLHEPMMIDDHMIEIDVSIGVAMYPRDGEDPDTLYRRADSAMFEAKREHVDYLLYTSALERVVPSDVIIARELRQALRQHQLDIVYQPELDLASGDLVRVEALVRWNHPQRGLLLPDEFIPAAERTRVMAQVTRWVLSSVIQQLRRWCDAGWQVNVSVNLSAWDLCDPSLPKYVQDLLEHWHVDPLRLTIETTETVLMADPQRARETLSRLRALGITLSLDDFGTGYSSLSFIRDLPSQEIKIDQSFIRNLDDDVNSATIVRALIQLAHELGRVTVAEGIETAAAWNVLKSLGCDTGQGYLMAQPMKATDLEQWLQTHEPERRFG